VSRRDATARAESTLHVLLHTSPATVGEWHAALEAALPGAQVARWPEVPRAVDYAVLWKPPPELFGAVRAPKAIFNLGAGVDALLQVPTLPAGVPVIRIEDGGMADQMVDYVTLAVLAAYREQRIYAAQQRDGLWQPRPYRDKLDFGVGLLGLGVLGQSVAAGLAHRGFPLTGWSRERKAVAGVRTYAGAAELPQFLARSQVLVCLLPATPATRGLIDAALLRGLPRGAHLVNVARGDIVVDADVVAALDDGQLASATLDVFREEPLPPGHPYWQHPRVTLTPHVSAITLVGESAVQIAGKIRRLERGLPVTGIVDRERGY
jgi:glyoxylate/hydroxypyruvate reductase